MNSCADRLIQVTVFPSLWSFGDTTDTAKNLSYIPSGIGGMSQRHHQVFPDKSMSRLAYEFDMLLTLNEIDLRATMLYGHPVATYDLYIKSKL